MRVVLLEVVDPVPDCDDVQVLQVFTRPRHAVRVDDPTWRRCKEELGQLRLL